MDNTVFLQTGDQAELVSELPDGRKLVRPIYQVEAYDYEDGPYETEALGNLKVVEKVFTKRPKIIKSDHQMEAEKKLEVTYAAMRKANKELSDLRNQISKDKAQAERDRDAFAKLAPATDQFLKLLDGRMNFAVSLKHPSIYPIDEISQKTTYGSNTDYTTLGMAVSVSGKISARTPTLRAVRSYNSDTVEVELFETLQEAKTRLLDLVNDRVQKSIQDFNADDGSSMYGPHGTIQEEFFTTNGVEIPDELVNAKSAFEKRRAAYQLAQKRKEIEALEKSAS